MLRLFSAVVLSRSAVDGLHMPTTMPPDTVVCLDWAAHGGGQSA